jgi:hypothetical protein
MSSPYYVNRNEDPIWCFTAMTKGGAWVLAKRYRDKVGCEIIEEPMLRDDDLWVFMVSNPMFEEAANV